MTFKNRKHAANTGAIKFMKHVRVIKNSKRQQCDCCKNYMCTTDKKKNKKGKNTELKKSIESVHDMTV